MFSELLLSDEWRHGFRNKRWAACSGDFTIPNLINVFLILYCMNNEVHGVSTGRAGPIDWFAVFLSETLPDQVSIPSPGASFRSAANPTFHSIRSSNPLKHNLKCCPIQNLHSLSMFESIPYVQRGGHGAY
jgi:hypothetical protein